MKNEIEHQLDLLKIYKETSNALSKSIAIMAQFTPPYMTYDFDERMKNAGETYRYCIELLIDENNHLSSYALENLQIIAKGSMSQKKLRLGIIMLEDLLEMDIKDEDASFFERETKVSIHMINCKNIILDSDINTDGSINFNDAG
mgnify:CR=1 FL=1